MCSCLWTCSITPHLYQPVMSAPASVRSARRLDVAERVPSMATLAWCLDQHLFPLHPWAMALTHCWHASAAGQKVKKVIDLQTGGTGFVAHDGDKAEAKQSYSVGVGNGQADLRGQLGAAMGRSLGGLSFAN